MQKWKQEYLPLKHRLTKEETGITLVELLAAISLLSVVILLAGSVHMFGQRQFINQTESASQANDLSYALTVISTELRKQPADQVTGTNNQISIDDQPVFYVSNGSLYQATAVSEDTLLAKSIDAMEVTEVEHGLEIHLKTSGQATQNKSYETTIHFRR